MNEKFGLNEQTYLKIKKALNKFGFKFLIFGSRARGDYKKQSDIDIAVLEPVSDEEKIKIKDELDKLDIIYFIDIVFANKYSKKELVDSIKKEGVEF